MLNKWIYFGCRNRPGHYLFTQGMHPNYDNHLRKLERFDGLLAPQDFNTPYIAAVTRLEGWGCSALSFWDYSVDPRGGCNSTIFAPHLEIFPKALLAESIIRFPEVFSRLPQEVKLLSDI